MFELECLLKNIQIGRNQGYSNKRLFPILLDVNSNLQKFIFFFKFFLLKTLSESSEITINVFEGCGKTVLTRTSEKIFAKRPVIKLFQIFGKKAHIFDDNF